MSHFLVEQYRFAISEWLRGHQNIPAEDALKRVGHANSIGWMVGHLAEFDQKVWVERVLGEPVTKATKKFGFRREATTPELDEVFDQWRAVQDKTSEVMEGLTNEDMVELPYLFGRQVHQPVSMWLLRMGWHYWYHLGEMQAVRQMLGHENLPDFVGSMPPKAQWSAAYDFEQKGDLHPLVEQTRFMKQKWLDGHEDLSAEDGVRRMGHANSISWMVGHLANFDQEVWLERPRGIVVNEAIKACAYMQPASTPDLNEMMDAWHAIQEKVDEIQAELTAEDMLVHPGPPGNQSPENLGTLMLRQMWHYWYHLGEMQGIRQGMGHENLAQYIGLIPEQFMWR
ncbi:MAG: DinB family protein [Chloroflexota bacterium]